MSPEIFDHISSGIQNLLLAGAVIIGGIWTVFQFSTLKVKHKAEAELLQLRLKAETASYEFSEKGAILSIDLEAKQETSFDSGIYVISVLVKIINCGVRTTLLDVSKKIPLNIFRVSLEADGTSDISYLLSQRDYNLNCVVMRAGYTVVSPLFVSVNSKGLYLIDYSAQLDLTEQEKDNAKRGERIEDVYWTGTTYILVK